jgi:hypothetical protein
VADDGEEGDEDEDKDDEDDGEEGDEDEDKDDEDGGEERDEDEDKDDEDDGEERDEDEDMDDEDDGEERDDDDTPPTGTPRSRTTRSSRLAWRMNSRHIKRRSREAVEQARVADDDRLAV